MKSPPKAATTSRSRFSTTLTIKSTPQNLRCSGCPFMDRIPSEQASLCLSRFFMEPDGHHYLNLERLEGVIGECYFHLLVTPFKFSANPLTPNNLYESLVGCFPFSLLLWVIIFKFKRSPHHLPSLLDGAYIPRI